MQSNTYTKTSDTYCNQPFTSLALKNWRKGKLKSVWPCCNMGNNDGIVHNDNPLGIDCADLSPQEIFDHPRMEELRQNLANGVRDSACSVCWRMEDNNVKSYRQHNISVHEKELTTIDVTSSNECNLACRMCGPSASNLWMQDIKNLKETGHSNLYIQNHAYTGTTSDPPKATESIQWQWMYDNTDKIKYLKCSGGEPLYDTKFIKLLEKYIADGTAKDTTVMCHTNGTQFGNPKIVEILNYFKKQEHSFSIDGFGQVYEYIRYPGTWDNLNDSLHHYFQMDNISNSFQITTVISALNLLNLRDLEDWSRKIHTKYLYPRFGKTPTMLNYQELYPTYRGTHLTRLPISILKVAKKRNVLSRRITQWIDAAIDNNAEDKQKMKLEIQLLDFSRNQDYHDYLDPILIDWLDS